jgi:perosamine synthetase
MKDDNNKFTKNNKSYLRALESKEKWISIGHYKSNEKTKYFINKVLDSNHLTNGKMTTQFENKFAKLHNVSNAIFCNSGTSAMYVALSLLKEKYGLKEGDEVIVPALTFVATLNTIWAHGLLPKLVDVEESTFTIDPSKIEAACSNKTRAIIPVHLYGIPCDMNQIAMLAKKNNLLIIEDACESVCAEYNGKTVGSFGIAGCFSTGPGHTLTTGSGGFITIPNDNDSQIVRSIINQGRSNNVVDKEDLSLFVRNDAPESDACFSRTGMQFRATELQAAVGLSQFDDVKNSLEKYRENAKYLAHGLSPLSDNLRIQSFSENRLHSFHMFPIIIKKPNVAPELAKYLEKNNIETRPNFRLLEQPIVIKKIGDLQGHYPIADNLGKNGIFIGCHDGLSKSNLDHIITVMKNFFMESKL